MSPERFIHTNGGGIIVGADPAVGSDCFIDRTSLVEGRSFISNGSRIVNSPLKDTHASFANITDSPVLFSHITGAIVRGSGLEGVVIRGTKAKTANVQNCLLSNRIVVEGCDVRGLELTGPFLLHVDWKREPRRRLLEISPDVQLGIIECRPGYAHVGCKCRKISDWVEHKEALRRYFTREKGWQGDEVDVIHELFEEWRRIRLAA